jgi:hypothetical protein
MMASVDPPVANLVAISSSWNPTHASRASPRRLDSFARYATKACWGINGTRVPCADGVRRFHVDAGPDPAWAGVWRGGTRALRPHRLRYQRIVAISGRWSEDGVP